LITTDTPLEQLFEFERNLKSFGAQDRLEYYRTPQFHTQFLQIAQILKLFRVDQKQIIELTKAAAAMRSIAQRILEPPGVELPFPRPIPNNSDQFIESLSRVVDAVGSITATEFRDQLLREIDSDYAQPMSALISLIPDELRMAKERLGTATESFASGRKEESVLYARKAWESCVNYALSRLPKKNGLDSLGKKTRYVLDEMERGDQTDLMVKIKGLFDGKFLHQIEALESFEEPEVPFFIALTTGFVHLVSQRLQE